MKKNNLMFCMLATLTIIAGCSKSSNSSGSSTYYMNCNVGGTTVNFSNSVVNGNSGGNPYFEIVGFNGTVSGGIPTLVLDVKNYNTSATATYNVDSAGVNGYAKYTSASGVVKLSKTGTMTITSLSPHTAGSFTFTCTDGTAVSGSFVAR